MLCAIVDQETNSIRVYDLMKGVCDESSQVWEAQAPWKYIFQDVRLRVTREGRRVAMAACAKDCACMMDMEDREVLWSTHDGANNPHAIELMPDGIIALASSYGAEVRFFDSEGEAPDQHLAAFPLLEAHGLLYDPNGGGLWALGHTELHYLRVRRVEKGMEVVDEAKYDLPSEGGHDLQPVMGSQGAKLWVTNFEGVWQFSVEEGTFSMEYPGSDVISREHTKGVGNFADGTVISIVPDGGLKPWTANSFRMFIPDGAGYQWKEIQIPGRSSYKVRAWSEKYCE